MAMRITHNMMYSNYVTQMQTSLGAYMESAEQGSTQKKVNRPSDDPAGTYKIMNLRNTATFNHQLLDNCDTAKGWLKLEDSVLSTQVPTVITSIKELAEQASTGTYTAEQRLDIAYQVRQQFGSLLNMSNTEFDGKSLFAGHKYDSPAFQQGLALMSKSNPDLQTLFNQGNCTIEGNSDSTIAFQFTKSGNLGEILTYRWTDDGGETWKTGTTTKESVKGHDITRLDFAGVTITMRTTDDNGNEIQVTACKEGESGVDANDGTVYIRPAAYYQGDINSQKNNFEVTYMGTQGGVSASPFGTFSGNNLIRFDTPVDESGGEFEWSYSIDNGMNWVSCRGNYAGTTANTHDTFAVTVPAGGIAAKENDKPNTARVSIENLASSAAGDTIELSFDGTVVTFIKQDEGSWASDNTDYTLTANNAAGTVTISSSMTLNPATGGSGKANITSTEQETFAPLNIGPSNNGVFYINVGPELASAVPSDKIIATINGDEVEFSRLTDGSWESNNPAYSLKGASGTDVKLASTSVPPSDFMVDAAEAKLTVTAQRLQDVADPKVSSESETYRADLSVPEITSTQNDSTITAMINGEEVTFTKMNGDWTSSSSDYALHVDRDGKATISSANSFSVTKANADLIINKPESLRLPLPEGYVDLSITGRLPAGSQIMIHPEDASLDYEIMKGTYISVNGVGKDIFGGLYSIPDGEGGFKNIPALLDKEIGSNLFEVVGNFIAYLETNCQDGCQETLAKLTKAEEYILTQSTIVGGLENRVDVAYDVLTSQKQDIKERLSYIEDIDLTELLVKMQQQQITYQTVLQSASKIMNMSLANYI